ncbi:ABC transporter ATP-binding protein [Actinopolymorpha alba]|uniref:ABC transporter ATP-binding protein n=1 Tax=Actinopolymorpha alba TaxID=533267 RepID=UPI00035E88E0|nr:ABC transporter ATP-binding protein [Actinopolymorpha alba]
MTAGTTLEARELYRFYRAGDEETHALRGTSVAVDAGEVVVVTGPSGAGKSTLLACLGGLDEPDAGTVFLNGVRLSHRPEQERAAARARGIGVLFQSGNLLPHLTVTGNVQLVQRLVRGGARQRPADVLHAVGLETRGHARPGELSGGESARAGLAVALANGPRVILADEPTGELDATTEAGVLELLRAEADRGCAIVIASHSPAVAAAGDRVIRLELGRIVGEARP